MNEELINPIGLLDILVICKEYSSLGSLIQSSLEDIIDFGVQDCIDNDLIVIESLPHIKEFLKQIISNPYFGEARLQAEECIVLIEKYLEEHLLDINQIN